MYHYMYNSEDGGFVLSTADLVEVYPYRNKLGRNLGYVLVMCDTYADSEDYFTLHVAENRILDILVGLLRSQSISLVNFAFPYDTEEAAQKALEDAEAHF